MSLWARFDIETPDDPDFLALEAHDPAWPWWFMRLIQLAKRTNHRGEIRRADGRPVRACDLATIHHRTRSREQDWAEMLDACIDLGLVEEEGAEEPILRITHWRRWHRSPSEDPEAVRERVSRHRARQNRQEDPESTPVTSEMKRVETDVTSQSRAEHEQSRAEHASSSVHDHGTPPTPNGAGGQEGEEAVLSPPSASVCPSGPENGRLAGLTPRGGDPPPPAEQASRIADDLAPCTVSSADRETIHRLLGRFPDAFVPEFRKAAEAAKATPGIKNRVGWALKVTASSLAAGPPAAEQPEGLSPAEDLARWQTHCHVLQHQLAAAAALDDRELAELRTRGLTQQLEEARARVAALERAPP